MEIHGLGTYIVQLDFALSKRGNNAASAVAYKEDSHYLSANFPGRGMTYQFLCLPSPDGLARSVMTEFSLLVKQRKTTLGRLARRIRRKTKEREGNRELDERKLMSVIQYLVQLA